MNTFLPDIESTWENYRNIAKPLRIRKVALRTINRIFIPLDPKKNVDLDAYLKAGPKLPKVEGRQLTFTNFLNQHQVVDASSGLSANIVLATQEPKDGKLPILLDMDAYDPRIREALEWGELA